MNTPKPMFVREVARIDDPRFVSGQVAGPVRTPFDRRRTGRADRDSGVIGDRGEGDVVAARQSRFAISPDQIENHASSLASRNIVNCHCIETSPCDSIAPTEIRSP